MCFVFTDCPVLCSVLLYNVLIVVMCLYLHFVLWIGVLVFGWCLFAVFVASLCFESLTVIENLVYLLLKRRVFCWWKCVPGLGE